MRQYAMDDIAGVVDIQRHPIRRGGVAGHPLIHQSIGQTDRIAEARGVLQTRKGQLGRQMAKIRARIMSATACLTRVGSRWSGMKRARRSAMPRRRSAWARSMTPPSDDKRPPSKAAVIFLRPTAGNRNGCIVRHGGCGSLERGAGSASATLRCFKCLNYTGQPSSSLPCIRTARMSDILHQFEVIVCEDR
ncbi:hypothetical protein ACVJGD_008368 [Bradyrhizobium sp. USDA 10063]